jgi:acid phosphatase (class A)
MRRIAAAVLLSLLAGCATAPPLPPAPPAAAVSYIAAAHLDATRYLPQPPAPDGSQQAADLAAVKAAQALKGQPRWIQAQDDDAISPYSAFGPVLGPAFTRERTPRTAALFEVLFADVKSQTAPAKEAFGRPRPPVVDAAIETCRPLETTRSYPSGHASRGWMMSLVLAEMLPERASDLLARGRDYGDSRVVCAEHFPSDVEAGRMIGAAVFAAAKADPRFTADFAAAKAELRAALGM